MAPPIPSMARIAIAAAAFEKRRTGHVPHSVTVVLGGDTIVVTLHGALSPAEQAMAASQAGVAELQKFHRELFDAAAVEFQREIQEITGVAVSQSKAEVETKSGTVVQVFSTGAMVQVYLLATSVPTDVWSQDKLGNRL